MAHLLRQIQSGKTRFEPDKHDGPRFPEFQRDANRLLEAERLGFVDRIIASRGSVGGGLFYTGISAVGGLTFQGEQFVSEHFEVNPDTTTIEATLTRCSSGNVSLLWRKCLARLESDPSGATTSARSLIESLFKSILEDRNVEISPREDLNGLWRNISKEVDLGLSGADAELLKKFLGSCSGMISSLGEIRNKLGDAHGKDGDNPLTEAHARLIVNVTGAFASFVTEVVENQKG